ncbi:hypothetical protein [Vibrio parahaemolyticus]|uniref:hypothetical protein n=1 Tax=Vibrio parahaemolyticus TaxID=670 RepID=UPI00040CACBD|nr:hypothetical protein [Vibrio parahaemolyticus]MDF4764776.1 hypothetical protein [Vibrio parahaemolyticus]HBC3405476.1 hypothetical protein [Vibrio parahaemolyticus]HBN6092759.1 hypothetical protein [Vibrio parahaemolyticus]HBN6183570.1 hypothetical protein [Vibrio parahaemolyticus]
MTNTSPLKEYWLAYGGWKALFSSKYFWGAAALNSLLFNSWYPVESKWWEMVLSITPNFLGFTLGGFAMWVAIGDEKFKGLIAGADEEDEISPYMEVNATFTHFLLLQILALILAIIAKSFDAIVINNPYMAIAARIYAFSAHFVFVYALLTTIAAVFAILKVAKWYDEYRSFANQDRKGLMATFATSDWNSYNVVTAHSPIDAARTIKNVPLKWVEHPSEKTVIHVMVVELSGDNESLLLKCKDDMERIRLLRKLTDTYHFQIS